jgi:inner membrane protein involved in colicin E2 resistance
MSKRIMPIIVIFLCTCAAWIFLSKTVQLRTRAQDTKLKSAVRELWGTSQKQSAPTAYLSAYIKQESEENSTPADSSISRLVYDTEPLPISGSDIKVKLDLDYRKKGLLWYSTYRVDFNGSYTFTNSTGEQAEVEFDYVFPSRQGIYDNFKVLVNGDSLKELQPQDGKLAFNFEIAPDESKIVNISYKSQGMDEWWYLFGSGVTQLKNFKLTMLTDFKDINFPDVSISPSFMNKTQDGWELIWDYESLISGIQIGMDLPQKLNPGPFVSRIIYFAPVSLFFFFFLIFVITILRKIDLHPINYFFLATAFFAFHLLLAYLVDHINIHAACLISSIVSILLSISYMRLVIGLKFALLETGLSQFVYLVLFSYAFFLEGYTGLTITALSILTLFIVMQATGKIDWNKYMPMTREAPEH